MRAHETDLANRLLAGVADLPEVKVHGFGTDRPLRLGPDRLATIALTVAGKDPATVSMFLDADWNIAVRSGLQCAPLAHEALGTAPAGTVRFACGPFNTTAQIERALVALRAIAV